MIDIFASDKIYGSSWELLKEREFNAVELSKINVEVPAEVFQGKFGLSCRIYIKGSTTAYYCKSLDTQSSVSEGQLIDIQKCKVTLWRKPDTSEVKIRILALDDAVV